jgi:hypothetical protein
MAAQGANNGASQGASEQFVKFSRQSAMRIARAVRAVEQGDRSQSPLVFEHPVPSGGVVLKVGTFTGSWQKGAWKTVTLQGSTATASVYNWCNSSDGSTSDTASSQFVVFGRANGTNSVLEISVLNTSQTCRMSIAGVDLTTFPGYSAGAIQLLGHSAASTSGTACSTLTWYSITTCSTAA